MNNASLIEWTGIEDSLTSLLSRVERRQQAAPATVEDGDLNHILHDNLREITRLSDQFMAVRRGPLLPELQANSLIDVAETTTHMAVMVRALENAPPLSPLFERLMNREYYEVINLMGRVKDAIVQNGRELEVVAENNPPAGSPPATSPDFLQGPSVAAWNMMASYAMVWGMNVMWASAWPAPLLQAEPAPKLSPAPHLTLVYSRS